MGLINRSFIKMYNLIYLACLSAGFALPSPPEYPTPAPTQGYDPDIGQTNVGGYGQQGPLLPHGGEGSVREPVRALHREDLLHTEQGVLQHQAVQKLHRCY